MSTANLAPPTTESIIALIASIEAQPPGSPAAGAFKAALRRKGFEAAKAGGFQAVDTIMAEVAIADPKKADVRTVLLRDLWPELMPKPEWPGLADGDRM